MRPFLYLQAVFFVPFFANKKEAIVASLFLNNLPAPFLIAPHLG